MNEAETRAELIDPLLAAAGWGVVEGSGGRRGKPLTADYVLAVRNTQLAVVETKPDTAPLSEGVGPGQGLCRQIATALHLRQQRQGHLCHRHGLARVGGGR